MKSLETAAKWIFILCLPVLLLSASITLAVNSSWIYKYGFDKFNVSQVTGIAQPELNRAADELVRYWNSDEEFVSISVIKDGQPFQLFNQKEVTHLKDVKDRFWLNYKILLATLVIVSSYAVIFGTRRDRRQLAWAGVGGGVFTLGLMAALGIGVLTAFDRLFYYFHLLLRFPNDFWLLDPSTDYLVMIVPEPFWYEVFIGVAGLVVLLAVLISWVGGAYLLRNRGHFP